MPVFRPDNFMILPTMACQASCTYCFAKKSGKTMPLETLDKTIEMIARHAPYKKDIHVTFHGGEPLLAGKAFYEYALPKLRKRFGQRVHIAVQSNLWAMTDELAELFRKYRVSVGTSLDGPEDMCDSQRGPGYYKKTKAGIELLRRHNIGAGAICTFSGKNAGRAAEVYRESTDIYSIHGAVPVLSENSRTVNEDEFVTPEQMTKILTDSYLAYKNDISHSRITTIDAMAKGCFEGKGTTCTFFDCLGTFAAVDPEGDIYSCQRFCGMKEYRLGNVYEDPSEEDILRSPGYRLLKDAQERKKASCGDCPHFEYCLGGCQYNTLASGEERDPYCPAYKALFGRLCLDMAKEMGAVMLGRDVETPVLSMAGDKAHPYNLRMSTELLKFAARKGREAEPFAAKYLRNPYPENDLNKLYLHVTFKCPLRCSHCYAKGGENPVGSLSPEKYAEIVKQAADNCFSSLVITGGEPLVYEGFDRLCELIRSTDLKGMKLILRTSLGFEVPEDRLWEIGNTFDEIVVSIDGDEKTHDARRGSGRYRLAADNLKRFSDICREKLS
ncbi:MAG: radical SAM protein, partial [Lachnospiraceae bacterium]|nr:radical SAM protein [Lachnospiraceae bacterium]